MAPSPHCQIPAPRLTPIFPTLGPFHLARWVRWECAALFVVGITFWVEFFLHQTDIVHYAFKMDFLGIYVGPRIVALGLGSQLYDLAIQKATAAASILPYERTAMPFVYPGYVAVLLRPLGSLAFGAAMKIWLLVNLAMIFWTAIRLSGLFAKGFASRLPIVAVCFAWTPLQITFVQGQMGLFPTVGFVEALIALRADRPWRAGLWLSLGLLKPQLVVFPLLLLLIWRCWQAIISFLAVTAAVVGISFAAVGFWIIKYLDFLQDYNRRGAELALYPIAMQNWRGLAYWIFGTDRGSVPHALIALLTGLSVAALWWISRNRPSQNGDEGSHSTKRDAQYAIAITLGILSSPHLYLHDWVAALPAGFALWCFARQQYAANPGDWRTSVLLWLIGLSPLVFFIKQFISNGAMIALYGLVLVSIAIAIVGFPQFAKQHTERFEVH